MEINEVVDMNIVGALPRQQQVQCSLDDQLLALYLIANKFGLYDAADFIMQQKAQAK
jgi:hypothetical protein